MDFELHPINHRDPHKLQQGRLAIEKVREKKRLIIQQYDIKSRLSNDIQNALNIIPSYIHERFNVDTESIDMPSLIFDSEHSNLSKELEETINPTIGESNYTAGSRVYINPTTTVLDAVGVAFHETLHFLGSHHFASIDDPKRNIVSNVYVRQGLEIVNPNSPLVPWVIEEGFVGYIEADFKEKVGKEILMGVWDDRNRLIQARFEDGVGDSEGHIVFRNSPFVSGKDIAIEPKYCHVDITDLDENTIDLSFPVRTALAGSLYEAIIQSFPENQREEFVQRTFQAKKNPTLIKNLAQLIDNHLGKGTYASLIRIPNNDESYTQIWNLIEKIRAKK